MSKKKGSAENLLKPGRKFYAHNAKVAMWGAFSAVRYSEVRQLVEGWDTASTYEIALQQPMPEPASQKEKQWVIDKSFHLNNKLGDLASKTVLLVRKAVENKDSGSIRKLADVIDHLKDLRAPNSTQAGSLDVSLLALYVRAKPAHHVFSFSELRDWLAEAEGIQPPFDENFEQRVRRIIKKIGIKVRKKRK